MTFEEATEVFSDPLARVLADAAHAERSLIVGYSLARMLTVVYVERERDGTIRIISARRATRSERKAYDEEA